MGGKQAEWIWYPGDFEIWLRREVELRRDERKSTIAPIWRVDSPYAVVRFRKKIKLDHAETVTFLADGELRLQIGERTIEHPERGVRLEEGEHEIMAQVHHLSRVPALFAKGETIVTDETWEVGPLWHSGFERAGRGGFRDPAVPPADFRLETEPLAAASVRREGSSLFVDFGRETFGYVRLHAIRGEGVARLVYGESEEEANDFEHCETYDELLVSERDGGEATVPHSRALRYVRIHCGDGLSVGGVSLLYEYLPLVNRGSFRSSDPQLNRIWEVSAYTFHLNAREFFLDGIKRDRWVWSGDAYQSYLMNYYLFFDLPITRRTIVALRGKDPVAHHLNTILDYTLYWFMGLDDYYRYTGDLAFIREQYGSMLRLMSFCDSRCNDNGMLEGRPEDWVFVDWADMGKEGELCFEQMLYCLALETVVRFSELLDDGETGERYRSKAGKLRLDIRRTFWDEEKGAYVHRRLHGSIDSFVTKHPNMFALLYGFLEPEQVDRVKREVLLNPDVPSITTPYMRFYELAALCEIGEQSSVREEIAAYWGGMLELGATSFWEEYDPAVPLPDQYAMYGRKYGKSLCHAWGASPLYLLGKYFLGVTPAKPGYEEVQIRPALGGLEWIEGYVPVPAGEVFVYMDWKSIRAAVPAGTGRLRFRSGTVPTCADGDLVFLTDGWCELLLDSPGREYEVRFTPTA